MALIDAHARVLRSLIPRLTRELCGRPLVFLDNASTTPKPRTVIDAVVNYYERSTANVHRGVHSLGEEATHALEFLPAQLLVRHQLREHPFGRAVEDGVLDPGERAAAGPLPPHHGVLLIPTAVGPVPPAPFPIPRRNSGPTGRSGGPAPAPLDPRTPSTPPPRPRPPPPRAPPPPPSPPRRNRSAAPRPSAP